MCEYKIKLPINRKNVPSLKYNNLWECLIISFFNLYPKKQKTGADTAIIIITNSKYLISCWDEAPTAKASIDKAKVVNRILKILSNWNIGSSLINLCKNL